MSIKLKDIMKAFEKSSGRGVLKVYGVIFPYWFIFNNFVFCFKCPRGKSFCLDRCDLEGTLFNKTCMLAIFSLFAKIHAHKTHKTTFKVNK